MSPLQASLWGVPSPGNPPPPMATKLTPGTLPPPLPLGGSFLRLPCNANRTAMNFSIICFPGNKARIVSACGKGQQFAWHKEFIFSFPHLSPITRPMAAGNSEAPSGRRLGQVVWVAGPGPLPSPLCLCPAMPKSSHMRVWDTLGFSLLTPDTSLSGPPSLGPLLGPGAPLWPSALAPVPLR